MTFGVAPSTIIFSQLLIMQYPTWLGFVADYIPFVAYVMAAFSALRLAKFNLDERQSMGFIGLPTPANALFWGSLILSIGSWLNTLAAGALIVIMLMLLSSYLLISEIPMFALKFKHWNRKGNELRYSFIGLSAIIIIAFTIYQGIAGNGFLAGFLGSWWIVVLIYVIVSAISDKATRHNGQ